MRLGLLNWQQPLQWVAAAVTMVALAACSGGAPPAEQPAGSAAAAPDACAMLTAADVERILGVPAAVQPSDQLKSASAVSMCTYEAADRSRNLVSVLVRVGRPGLDPQTNLKQYVDGLKMNMGDAYPIDPVEGLSGPALWNPDMKQLTVFQGAALAILTMFETQGKDPLESAKALAEKTLSRM